MIPTVRGACCTLGLLLFGCGGSPAPEASTGGKEGPPLPPVAASDLRAPEAFAGISDTAERSRALFAEASRVILHPRCLNCHPAGDAPHQRDEMTMHEPPVVRGPEDKGVVGVECTSCHQDRNPVLARVPGAPKWHLAPKIMAWEGRSAAAICAQVKDPARNGGKSLQDIVEHAGHDALVGWAWSPGADRAPAPGSQAKFGALVAAWVATGAACPPDKSDKSGKEATR